MNKKKSKNFDIWYLVERYVYKSIPSVKHTKYQGKETYELYKKRNKKRNQASYFKYR